MTAARPFHDDPSTLRVLDLGTQVAGPFATTLLGDLGAEVIKCEQPGSGDPIRQPDGLSPRWQSDGRNKRSVTLNLRLPDGQRLLGRLAEWADVLIENFRPGTMERWGLGYDALSLVNPRLVYVSVSGFGQTGPYSPRPGYDPIGAAFGGLMHSTRSPDGQPVLPGLWTVDHMTGMFAALGALEAVRRRDGPGGSGRGERIESALYESVLRLAGFETVSLSQFGSIPPRSVTPPYRTRDGRWVSVWAVGQDQFDRLCDLVDDPVLHEDRFRSRDGRMEHAAEYYAVVGGWVARQDLAPLLDALREADVPSSAINSFEDVMADPHVAARGDLVRMVNARGATVALPAPVPRFAGAPLLMRWVGEELGASNADVYQGLLGLSAEECAALAASGVI